MQPTANVRAMPLQTRTPARSVRVDPALWATVKDVAEERGETVSGVITAALRRYVKRAGR